MELLKIIRSLAFFELKSFIGRRIIRCKPQLNTSGENYLNLGCGANIVPGYINADFFFFKRWQNPDFKLQWQLDLRYPLQCEDEVFAGVFCEHTIEHLTVAQVGNLFREIFRAMKPGAFFRLIVPDLEKYVVFYRDKEALPTCEEFKRRFNSGCAAFRFIAQDHGHLSLWDSCELKSALKSCGFVEIEQVKFNCSRDELLKLDSSAREWESLYVECKKP